MTQIKSSYYFKAGKHSNQLFDKEKFFLTNQHRNFIWIVFIITQRHAYFNHILMDCNKETVLWQTYFGDILNQRLFCKNPSNILGEPNCNYSLKYFRICINKSFWVMLKFKRWECHGYSFIETGRNWKSIHLKNYAKLRNANWKCFEYSDENQTNQLYAIGIPIFSFQFT